MDVAGVDGYPEGWVVVHVRSDATLRIVSVQPASTFAQVMSRTRECTAVAIDIPIGLSDDDRRAPDIEARAVLRPYRHNSVFPAPIRPVLGATSYAEANEISARMHRHGKKISRQTWALVPKIDDVDRGMVPELQQRVIEVHPEVCFWALNDHRPVMTRKRSTAGAEERLALLSAVYAGDLGAIEAPQGAARDDLLDACAAAWTASRYARGEAQRLPSEPSVDARGLRMEIVY